MAASDNLTLTASVRDDFTATLRKLQGQLQNLAADQGPAKLKKEWTALGAEVKTAAQSVATSFVPAMRSGNVVGLGLGATLGAVAVGMKNFASEIRSTSRIAAELKTPAANIERIFLQAQVGVGLSTQQMSKDLESFAANIRNLRFDKPSQQRLISEFNDVGRAIVNLVDKDLNKVPRKFSEIFEEVGKRIQGMTDPVRQRALAKAIFDDEEMARYFTTKVDPVLEAQIKKFAGAAERNEAAAKRFNAALGLMSVAATNLRNEALSPLLQVTSELMTKYQEPIGQGLEQFAANMRRDLPLVVDSLQKITGGDIVEGVNRLAGAWAQWHPIIRTVNEALERVSKRMTPDALIEGAAAGLGMPPGGLAKAVAPTPAPVVPAPALKPAGEPPLAPATQQSIEKISNFNRYLDEALHPKTSPAVAPSPNAAAAEIIPFPPPRPRGIGGYPEVAPLPPRRPAGLGVAPSAQAVERQVKASEDVAQKTDEQTKVTETANRRSDSLTHALERSRSTMDRLREAWTEFVNKLSPDAVVGMGAAGLGMGSGGLGGVAGAGGIAGGLGGIGPAGRGGAGMPSGPGGGSPVAAGSSWAQLHKGTSKEVYDYIRKAAEARGIDPDTAIAVANSEGLKGYDPSKMARDKGGDQGRSFGPFQLFTGGGLGNRFKAATGLDPSDPSTYRQQVDFALDVAKKEGWGAWYGPRDQKLGIGRWGGIGGRAGYQATPGLSAAGLGQGAAKFVSESQIKNAGIRNMPISNELRGILNEAGEASGLVADIYSGGQSHGGFRRTGSHRHDIQPGTIGAADLRLVDPTTGRRLNMEDPEDRQKAAGFVREAARRGATGFGYGTRYMGPQSLHVGGGNRPGDPPAFWGGGHGWVREAAEEGFRQGAQRPGALLNKASEAGVNGGSPSAKVDARGSVNITLSDSLKDKNVKTSTEGMFKDVQVGRGRPATPPENGPNWDALGRASAGF